MVPVMLCDICSSLVLLMWAPSRLSLCDRTPLSATPTSYGVSIIYRPEPAPMASQTLALFASFRLAYAMQ
eukprot:46615-Amphidinium_carterae.1